jgi:hypothetical protein
MSTTATINRSSIHYKEYPLHPQFYQILNIPPCPLSKGEMLYQFHNYLERIGALVTTEDNQEKYILIGTDVSILSGLNVGDTFTLHDRRAFIDFVRTVWRRVRLSK